MKAIDREQQIKSEIKQLNRRIGQLRRHDNIWGKCNGRAIAAAEWERDNKLNELNDWVAPRAREERAFWHDFWK